MSHTYQIKIEMNENGEINYSVDNVTNNRIELLSLARAMMTMSEVLLNHVKESKEMMN